VKRGAVMKNVSDRSSNRGKVKINESLITVVDLLKTDFQINNEKYKTIGFFRKSPCHYMMLLNIVENSINKKPITFEGILKDIPDKNGSRSKIFQVLKDAISEGILSKNKNFADNREQIYYLSEVSTREINEWLKIFKCL
tara:strand:+ start:81 stop:500 length:420 start_codon:yes stop_codon:yes gene_type:complete